jgi:probable phosphoglycerate mutase
MPGVALSSITGLGDCFVAQNATHNETRKWENRMRLYFVRHGESVANVERVFSNSGFKHPLTEKGIEQARLLAHNLAGQGISRIYSSPVMRAVQTAEILSQTLNAEIEITEALREWSVGILEDTDTPEGWEMHRQVQEDWFLHGKLENKIPEGENFLEIRERFVPFIEKLVEAGRDSDERVVLIGHGGLFVAMLPVVLKGITHPFAASHGFPNTGYVLAEARAGGLYCLEWCGTPFGS